MPMRISPCSLRGSDAKKGARHSGHWARDAQLLSRSCRWHLLCSLCPQGRCATVLPWSEEQHMQQSPSSPHPVSTMTLPMRFATALELSRSKCAGADITKAADIFRCVCDYTTRTQPYQFWISPNRPTALWHRHNSTTKTGSRARESIYSCSIINVKNNLSATPCNKIV